MKPNVLRYENRFFVIILALVAIVWTALPAQGQQEIQCSTMEKNGEPVYKCVGTIDLKGPVTFKVKNTLNEDHGFSIDTMKVKEVIKPGEEKTIIVPLENIDKSVSKHVVYCQLHGKKKDHMKTTIKVVAK